MSMQFDPELDDKRREALSNMIGQMTPAGRLLDCDSKQALFTEMPSMQRSSDMSELARQLNATVTLELNSIGDKKTIGDIDYILTSEGWIRQLP